MPYTIGDQRKFVEAQGNAQAIYTICVREGLEISLEDAISHPSECLSRLGLLLVVRSKNWGDAFDGKYKVLKEKFGAGNYEESDTVLLTKLATLFYLNELSPPKTPRGRNTDTPRRQYDLIRTLKSYLRSTGVLASERHLIRLAALLASFQTGNNHKLSRNFLSCSLQHFERKDNDTETQDIVLRVERSIQKAKSESKTEEYKKNYSLKLRDYFFRG